VRISQAELHVPAAARVIRGSAAVLVLVKVPEPAAALANELAALCETAGITGETSPGRQLARRAAGLLAAAEPEQVPDFCLLADTATGTQVVLHGDIEVALATDGGDTILSGAGVASWVDRLVAGPVHAVTVSPAASPMVTVSLADAAVPAADPLPLDDAPAPEREPGKATVVGIHCQNGHFNRPDVLYCSACGVSTVHLTARPVEGPRPPLGVVVLDDGTTYVLDSDYVIGRDPETDPAVIEGTARPLVLDDPDRSVSRVHAEIRLNGWDVTVVDRGGANGTHVCAPGAGAWTRLDANVPAKLTPGSHVLVGRRTFVFNV
jgi:hypothetical protein